eukprot:gene5535-3992_t
MRCNYAIQKLRETNEKWKKKEVNETDQKVRNIHFLFLTAFYVFYIPDQMEGEMKVRKNAHHNLSKYRTIISPEFLFCCI